MKISVFPFLCDFTEPPFACHFSKPKAPAVVYAPAPATSTQAAPTTVVNNVTPAPPPPPAPSRATRFVRDEQRRQTPRAGRRSTMLTGEDAILSERRRSMLGTPYVPVV